MRRTYSCNDWSLKRWVLLDQSLVFVPSSITLDSLKEEGFKGGRRDEKKRKWSYDYFLIMLNIEFKLWWIEVLVF